MKKTATKKKPLKKITQKDIVPPKQKKSVKKTTVEDIFDNFDLLNEKQKDYLLNIEVYNKNEIEYLLTIDNNISKDFLMNILSLVRSKGFDYVYALLESNNDLLKDKNEDADQKRKKILMKTQKNEESVLYIEINNFKFPIKISEGIVDCRRCKSKETISSQKQTRAGDEPVTITIYCFACKDRWTI